MNSGNIYLHVIPLAQMLTQAEKNKLWARGFSGDTRVLWCLLFLLFILTATYLEASHVYLNFIHHISVVYVAGEQVFFL